MKPELTQSGESSTKKGETDQNETTTEENSNHRDNIDSKNTEKPMNENGMKHTESKNSEHKRGNVSAAGMESSGANKTNVSKQDDSPKPVIPLDVSIKPTKTLKNSDSSEPSRRVNNEKLNNKSTISKTSTKSFATSTLNVETSSSVQVIEPSTTIIRVQSTMLSNNNDASYTASTSNTVTVEPSKSDDERTTISTSIPAPTEHLPSTFTKILPTTEKNIVHTPVSNTFAKNSGRTFASIHS